MLHFLRSHQSLLAAITLAVTGVVLPALAAIEGTVINRTTGEPASRVPVTLVSFGGTQGMSPVDEIYTDETGKFFFDDDLLQSGSQPIHGMLRAEYEGVSYSKMIVPNTPLDNVQVDVYSVAEEATLKPEMTALLFEPGEDEMVVNQFFQFMNDADPPRTFRNAVQGTLQFHLPPEADGKVQVRATGPSGMPLRSTAAPTDRPNVYMVDFPLKPGNNLVELTYRVPYAEGQPFQGRILYEDVETRFVIPEGVSLEADSVVSIGQEPQSQASIYEFTGGTDFSVTLRGEGRLGRAGGGAPGGGGTEITIAPAPISKELTWIFVITAAILGLGFYHLLMSKPPENVQAKADTAGSADGAKRAKSSTARGPARTTRRKR